MGSFIFELRSTRHWVEFSKDWKTKTQITERQFKSRKRDVGRNVFEQYEKENLQTVDEKICEFMGEPAPSKDLDSFYYMMCHEWGYTALYKLGGSWVEQRHVDWMLERIQEARNEDTRFNNPVKFAKFRHFLTWVFLEEWRFVGYG